MIAAGSGFADAGASGISTLRANTTKEDFRFTFPYDVPQAGLYLRDIGTFNIQALNASGSVLQSTSVTLTFTDLVEFRGFSGLTGLRAIRVTEAADTGFATDFDDIQWTAEPSSEALAARALATLGAFRLMRHKRFA